MVQCLLGLGSNLGDRTEALRAAWLRIANLPDVRSLRLSDYQTTTPVGGPTKQGQFLNAAAVIETSLPPETLLAILQQIESDLGRVREERWGPRSIDLDLLLYGDRQQRTLGLTLPHPRMAFRRFVLEPAAQIAPEMIYPVNGWLISQLLENLTTAPNYVALALGDHVEHRTLLARLGARQDVEIVPRECAQRPIAEWTIKLSSNNSWLITDFWLNELDRQPTDGRGFESAAATQPQPKLVVVVDRPPDSATPSTVTEPSRRQLWQGLAHRADVGPILWLETGSCELVADEVVAALDAMR